MINVWGENQKYYLLLLICSILYLGWLVRLGNMGYKKLQSHQADEEENTKETHVAKENCDMY